MAKTSKKIKSGKMGRNPFSAPKKVASAPQPRQQKRARKPMTFCQTVRNIAPFRVSRKVAEVPVRLMLFGIAMILATTEAVRSRF